LHIGGGIDRRRIAALEHEEPQPMQEDRGEILRALLAAKEEMMMGKCDCALMAAN